MGLDKLLNLLGFSVFISSEEESRNLAHFRVYLKKAWCIVGTHLQLELSACSESLTAAPADEDEAPTPGFLPVCLLYRLPGSFSLVQINNSGWYVISAG